MDRRGKAAVFEMVALGRYGGSKAQTMDIAQGERMMQPQAPNLIGRGRYGANGEDQNCSCPLGLITRRSSLVTS